MEFSATVDDLTIAGLDTRQVPLHAVADIPDGDRIVVAARDVEELISKSGECRR